MAMNNNTTINHHKITSINIKNNYTNIQYSRLIKQKNDHISHIKLSEICNSQKSAETSENPFRIKAIIFQVRVPALII